MPNIPIITARQAIRAFERAGFYVDRQTGSHCIMKKVGHPSRLSIPFHKGRTLGVGLLKSLIDDSGLTVEQFINFL